MSSDGSVSSRVSQFGLYRTIDARTEEFLKLSKRRQIKQGCVCAAISTALTVTVVVIILLIYEYNIITEARRASYKSNWLNLINNSADDPSLLEMFDKEKFKIDRTTFKLLPILLNALNHNRYAEKIIEEPTSLNTPDGNYGTTEIPVTKNIFADTRNWMKTPHSRLYTLEYKTSPIAYIKHPTRNIDYFTKIRKIRDYQRILNYVDKMISEKNSLGITQPMKNFDRTEEAFKTTTPFLKPTSTQKVVKLQETTPKTATDEIKVTCKCSNKLGELMTKLLHSIKHLLAYISITNINDTVHRCNKSRIQTKPIKLFNKNTAPTSTSTRISGNNIFQPKTTLSYIHFLNKNKYVIDSDSTKSFDMRRDYTINKLMNLIKPNFSKNNNVEIKFESNEAVSTTNSYYKLDSKNDIYEEVSSKIHSDYGTSTKAPINIKTTIEDYTLNKEMYDISDAPEVRSSLSTFPEPDFTYDDIYTDSSRTTASLANHFNKLDAHSLELIKSKIVSERKDENKDYKSSPIKGARISQKHYGNIESMRKMGKLVSSHTNSLKDMPMLHRFAATSKPNVSTSLTKTTLNTVHLTSTIKPIAPLKNMTSTEKNTTKCPELKELKQNITTNQKSKENTLLDQQWDETTSEETTLHHIEEAVRILNNETGTQYIENITTILDDTYQWELIKLDENTSTTKSMVPLGRSTYLEIERNDWKYNENQDFDTEINNYIFE